jgi:hypothetical protein
MRRGHVVRKSPIDDGRWIIALESISLVRVLR